MNKHVVPITNGLPATKAAVKKWRVMDALAEACDTLVERNEGLCNMQRAVRSQAADLQKGDELVEVELLDDDDREQVAKCRETLALLDPLDDYDDDGDLKRDIISRRLALLVGSYPAGVPGNPEVFVRMLLEHVAAIADLRSIELDAGCRSVAETIKFLNCPAEVMPAIREQQKLWSKRRSVINNIEWLDRELAESFAALKPKWEASAAARQHEQASHGLDVAHASRRRAAEDAIAKQLAARTASAVALAALERLASCEAEVVKAEQALAGLISSRAAR